MTPMLPALSKSRPLRLTTVTAMYVAQGIQIGLLIVAMLLFQALIVGALFVLRRTRPEAERPYRVWGYPVVPALYLLAVGFLLVNTLFATPGRAVAGLGLIALGLPVYAYYARRLPPDDPADWLGEEPEADISEPEARPASEAVPA